MGDYYHGQYLITFIDHEIADEWWRMMSSSSSPYARNITRSSPQVYTQTSGPDVVSFFAHSALPDATRFKEKVFFTRIMHGSADGYPRTENPTPVPCTDITDHISGRW